MATNIGGGGSGQGNAAEVDFHALNDELDRLIPLMADVMRASPCNRRAWEIHDRLVALEEVVDCQSTMVIPFP